MLCSSLSDPNKGVFMAPIVADAESFGVKKHIVRGRAALSVFLRSDVRLWIDEKVVLALIACLVGEKKNDCDSSPV